LGIGRKIAKLRQARNLTQKELAKRANISLSSLKKIEEGYNYKPNLGMLARIANALGVELKKILEE